jgi:ubiquinone/menaquinone biosynthesis C-methylase UbiE
MPQPKTDLLPAKDTPVDFERLYLAVRGLEERIYTDEELRHLPEIPRGHVHYKEWQLRKRSARRLQNYLAKKEKALNILEIGCGNGWLAAKLASIENARVFGLDVNRVEIYQAKRVFTMDNLQFFSGGFDGASFTGMKFDVILFAASIQYFSPLKKILQKMQQHLTDEGEIHIIDSNFYNAFTVEDAITRTQQYYLAMHYPEMAVCYFHHRLDELEDFNYQILSKPAGFLNRLLKGSPFYWLKIHKDKV